MITPDCMDRVLPVVADSWERLRRIDVYRLMTQFHYETPESVRRAGEIIGENRPDLKAEADAVVGEIIDELFQNEGPEQ
jgi:hypothetical protein